MKKLALSALLLLTHVCSADIVRTYTGTSTTVCTTVNGTGTSWECTETCTWKSVITATATNKITVGVESSPNSPVGPVATITDVNGSPILVGGVILTLEPSTAVTDQLLARYGAISTGHSWHGFTTNVPLTAGGPVGSQAVFKLKFEWPASVSPQGAIFFGDDGPGVEDDFGSIPPFSPNPTSYSGLAHSPAGNGAIAVTPAGLHVSNIGSSGQDGVEIDLPNVSHWEAHWSPLDPANSLPVGAFVRSAIFGSSGTVNNGLLGSWRLIKLGQNDYGVTANFAPMGVTTVTAQIYSGGTLVTTVPGQTGQFVRVNGCVDDDHWGNPTPDGPFGLPGKFGGALTFLGPLQFSFSNGSSVIGDRLVILPDGAPPVSSLNKAMVVAKDIPNIYIDHERHFLNYKGLAHGSLGQANLRKGASLLTVSNLGSSGQDGVSVSLGDSEAFLTEIPLDPGLPIGGYMISNFTGPNTLGTMVPLGKVGMRRLPTSMAAIVDFADLGSPTYTATVYRAGVPVLTGSGLSGEVVQMTASGRIECNCRYSLNYCEWTWKFPPLFGSSSAAFTIPGVGTNVPGDEIVFTPDVSFTTQIRPTQVDIVGAEMPMFQFSSESIRKLGLDCAAAGSATLNPTGTGLLVSNLGSSGQDGVEIALSPPLLGMEVGFTNPDPLDQLPVGAATRIRSLGVGSGLSWTKTGSQNYRVDADFSTQGAPSWTVEVYDGATLVSSQPGQTDPFIASMHRPIIEISSHYNSKTKCTEWDIIIDVRDLFDLRSGASVMGDKIIVRPDGGLASPVSDTVMISTTAIPSLNIIQAEKTLNYAGLTHTSMGQANVDVLDGEPGNAVLRESKLLVSNLGSSGQDGVSIKLPASQSFTTSSILNPSDPENSYVTSSFYAPGAGGEVPAGLLCMRRAGVGYSAIVDFAPLGAPTYTAQVFRQGTLVATSSGLTGDAVTFTVAGGIRIDCVCTYKGPDFYNWEWTWRFSKTSGATTAAFTIPGSSGGGSVDGDLIVFTPEFTALAAPVAPTRVDIVGANIPDFTILSESIGFRELEHTGLGGVAFDTLTGNLALVGNLGSSGQDGVDIHLSNVASCDFSWLPLDLQQPSPIGAWIQTDFSGSVSGVPDQSLGFARVTRVDSSATGYEMSADLTPLASPTVLVEVWNHDTLVASLPGIAAGGFGRSSKWPIGGGKTGRGFGDWVLGCISWDYPDLTNFLIQGNSYVGTRVLMLQESAPVANSLSGCRISLSQINGTLPDARALTITGESTSPLPTPSGFAKIKFDCTYKLIPPTCTWRIYRTATTSPNAIAGVVYHLQEAVQVPTDYSNLQFVNERGLPFALSPDVAAKAEALHPAPSGYIWVGFQSVETFGNNSATNLIEDYGSRVTFGTADPANTAGASWFGSDAPVGSGYPSGEIYQLFVGGPPLDSDGDDLPDTWETTYGLNPNLATDAALDLDGDGMSNGGEYAAGTDPANSASILKMEIVNGSPYDFRVRFEAVAGKTYLFEESSDLSTWNINQVIPPAAVPHTVDTAKTSTNPPPKRFFRVRQ